MIVNLQNFEFQWAIVHNTNHHPVTRQNQLILVKSPNQTSKAIKTLDKTQGNFFYGQHSQND